MTGVDQSHSSNHLIKIIAMFSKEIGFYSLVKQWDNERFPLSCNHQFINLTRQLVQTSTAKLIISTAAGTFHKGKDRQMRDDQLNICKTFSTSVITVQQGKEVKGLPLDLCPLMAAKVHNWSVSIFTLQYLTIFLFKKQGHENQQLLCKSKKKTTSMLCFPFDNLLM